MTDEKMELVGKCRSSSFCKGSYNVNIDLKYFVENLLLFTDVKNEERVSKENFKTLNYREWLSKVTPNFQRDNNKWSKKMKTLFVENILKGASTEFMYFRFEEHEDAQIIDGLQRTTALIDFFEGKIKPFGYSYLELDEYVGLFNTHMTIKIYNFETWEDVGRFYIDMNENITHSKKDIQKAKDWFLNEHGIVL